MADHKITTEQIRDYHRLANSKVLRARLEEAYPSVFTPVKKTIGELSHGVWVVFGGTHAQHGSPMKINRNFPGQARVENLQGLMYGADAGSTDYQIVKPPPVEQWEVVEDG